MNKIKSRLGVVLWAVSAAFLLPGCGLAERCQNLAAEFFQEEDAGQSTETQKKAARNKTRKEVRKASKKAEPETVFAEEGTEASPQEDRYADFFAYRTLDDSKQEIYREVLTAIREQEEQVSLSTTDVDVLEEAYKAVCADHGDLYWVSGYVYTQYTRGGKLIGMDFAPKYTMDFEQRNQIGQQIDDSVQELLAGISRTDSDYDKAKYVFEILVQNVDYDSGSENNQNIISTFLNRATVCQGYAAGAQYLLRQLGIQSVIVTGEANGESHAWNLVRLDGNYYYMDVTWGNSRYLDSDSQVEKYVNYNYMAVTSEEIRRTHRLDLSFALPECTETKNNYFIREGRYFTEWNPDAVGAVLAEAWNAGAKSTAVKFASRELYDRALAYLVGEQHIADYCDGITSIYYLEDRDLFVVTFHF